MRVFIISIVILACAKNIKPTSIENNQIDFNSILDDDGTEQNLNLAGENIQSSNLNEQSLDGNEKLDTMDILIIEKSFNRNEEDKSGESDGSDDEEEEDHNMKERLYGIEIPICAQYAEVPYPLHVSHLTDCGKFYKCSNGRGYLFDCPANEEWSVKFDRCDYPDIAGCTIDGTHQFKLKKQVKHKQANDNDDQNDSENDDDDSFGDFEVDPRCEGNDPFVQVHFSHSDDCTKYYKCYMGKAFVVKCPKGQHWGQRLNRCDHPSLARCSSIKHAVSFDDNTVDEKREKMNSISFDPDFIVQDERCTNGNIDHSRPIQFEHPSDCQMFYKCFNGLAYKVSCPGGLHFNVDRQQCDYPHIAKCASSIELQTA